jgi:hypothetical protein
MDKTIILPAGSVLTAREMHKYKIIDMYPDFIAHRSKLTSHH